MDVYKINDNLYILEYLVRAYIENIIYMQLNANKVSDIKQFFYKKSFFLDWKFDYSMYTIIFWPPLFV